MLSKIQSRIIGLTVSLLDAMKLMDNLKVKTLFVMKEDHFEGIITIGDIQRTILSNISLKEPVSRILNKNKIYGYQSEGKRASVRRCVLTISRIRVAA